VFHSRPGLTLWAGTAHYLLPHRGIAPVMLVGLYGKFSLRMSGCKWTSCGAAVIPPSLWHELDFGGQPFSALYVDPIHGGLQALLPLLNSTSEAGGALMGEVSGLSALRSVYESIGANDSLNDLLSLACRKSMGCAPDPRIVSAICVMNEQAAGRFSVAQLARRVDLSPSRFQHLFTRQLGIPFRRYRTWLRLRAAVSQIARGASVTTAAHEAGFFDSAHLAREHRKTFGTACSSGTLILRPDPTNARFEGTLTLRHQEFRDALPQPRNR
jgi:AraC-like DNA-binding protein